MVDQKHGGDGMGAVAVDGANGEAVGSVEQMFGRFSAELIHQFPAWRKRLADRRINCLSWKRMFMLPACVGLT